MEYKLFHFTKTRRLESVVARDDWMPRGGGESEGSLGGKVVYKATARAW